MRNRFASRSRFLSGPGPWLSLLLTSVLIQGCAASSGGVRPETSTPTTVRIQGTRGGDVYLMSEVSKGTFHLAAPLEEAWAAAPDLFKEMGVEVNYRIPGSRAIGNNGFRVRRIGGVRNSQYLDCGYGSTAVPHADGYEVNGSLVVTFRAEEEGGTVMETVFSAAAKARAVSGGSVACTSKGKLEQHMAERLTELVADRAARSKGGLSTFQDAPCPWWRRTQPPIRG